MNEALRNRVCDQEDWSHAHGRGFYIKFNHDGTGELVAVGEMGSGWFFTTCMRWREVPLSKTIAEILKDVAFQDIKHNNILSKRPELLGCLRFEITLENVSPSKAHWPSTEALDRGRDRMLSDAAYLRREFTIVIESGNFSAVRDYGGWNGLRMTFDISPYPNLEGYREGSLGTDWLCEWLHETKAFYAGKPAESLANTRATEDDTILGYHISKCVTL